MSRNRYDRYTSEDIAALQALAAEDCTQRLAAERLGWPKSTVSVLARENGIEFHGGVTRYANLPPATSPAARGQARLEAWKYRKRRLFDRGGRGT